MSSTIGWGILGTGAIAHKFAEGLTVLDDAALVATGSRTQAAADAFAEDFDVPHRHVGMASLVADADVDVIYVATPHPMHKEDTLTGLRAGKAMLCEKPFCMNEAEAREVVACARAQGVFLMEAMWTQFFPAMARARELIRSGAIGDVRQVHADFCFRAGWNPEGRILNPALGGGALLDVGIYNVALAHMAFQREPVDIRTFAHIGETGVDEQSSTTLGYDDGALATLTCAIRTNTRHEACVYGTEGSIRIPPLFWQPRKIVVQAGDQPEAELTFDEPGNGYNYEAAEVMRCLREGEHESPIVPLDTTLAVMRTLDRIRASWGLTYPMESDAAPGV